MQLGYDHEVVSITVMDGDKLLMGKRRDNGKWTLPGGHMEEGEEPHEAALRELEEETGIATQQLRPLGSNGVIGSNDGKMYMIHSFHLTCQPKTTTRYDPDREVVAWKWIDVSGGIPKVIEDNLHCDFVNLKLLDLYDVGFKVKTKAFKSDVGESEFYIRDQIFYISDILKSRPHKYIRKYKGHGGDWVYIYHEGDSHGRRIDEAAVQKIKRLAELGHRDSIELHGSIEAHDENMLKILRRLSDLGNKDAIEKLKSFGIDRESEKMEEKILGGRESDPYKMELDSNQSIKMSLSVASGLAKMFDRFSQHPNSEPERALGRASVTREVLIDTINSYNPKSVADYVEAVDKALVKVDNAHRGINSGWDEVRDAGGYGNLVFNTFVEKLENHSLIPRGVSAKFKRTEANRGQIKLDSQELKRMEREAAERKEREVAERRRKEAERIEEERRISTELEGSMASFMSSICLTPMSARDTLELHKNLKNIFGGRIPKKEDWPYDFSEHGLHVKIKSIRYGSTEIHFSFEVKNDQGQEVIEKFERYWYKGADGDSAWMYNQLLVVPKNMRGGRVGPLVNKAQLKFMKKFAPKGYVDVTANIDVGAYTWASCGFRFKEKAGLNEYREQFRSFAASKGIVLSWEDMQKFTLPLHFSSFDDGKIYQYTPRGSSDVMHVHLGKLFCLNRSWKGVMKIPEMKPGNEVYDYFMEYDNNREHAWKLANPEYKELLTSKRQSQQRRSA